MNLTDAVYRTIIELLEQHGVAEIQRNELAAVIGCVPSQINYVLTSRFTPEQGYIIESRRGGGGYIRIKRARVDRSGALMHMVNSIGSRVDKITATVMLHNLFHQHIIEEKDKNIIYAAISDQCMREVPADYRDSLRAAILKQMLLCML